MTQTLDERGFRSPGTGRRRVASLRVVKRPFWLHQLVEYLLGVLLVAQGLQTSKPLVPTLLGAAVLLNAATARGPVAAFPRVPRPVHRWVDVALVAVIVGAALLTGDQVTPNVRWVLLGVAVVDAFVVLRSDYTPPVARQKAVPADGRSAQIGRAAGRMTGMAVNAARNRRRQER